MKTTFYLPILLLIALFSSCKKDEFENINNKKELTSNLIFTSPDIEPTGHIAASINGKYLYTIQSNEEMYFSKDNGENWDNIYINMAKNRDYEKNLKISDGGYSIIEGPNGSLFHLVNLNNKPVDKITPPVDYEYYAKMYVGKDDYLYFIYQSEIYFSKIGSGNWEILDSSSDELGAYLGQEVTKGGIAFYNGSTNKFSIHNPSNNTISTKNITIDMSQIPSSGKPASAGQNAFDGKNYFAYANDNGVAIANISSGAVSYKSWGDFDISTSQVQHIAIDSEGTAYIKWNSQYNKSLTNYFKLKDNKLTEIDVPRGRMVALDDNIYFYGAFKLHKLSAGKEEQFYSVNRVNKRTQTKLNSVALSGNDIFILIDYKLHKYTRNSDSFAPIEDLFDIKFNYLYADGKKIRAYGGDYTAFSDDGGDNWEIKEITDDVRYVRYITKSGSTYYGMALTNEGGTLGQTGFSYSAFSLTVLSSTDAIHWEEYSPKLSTNGYAPTTMSPDGIITYFVNLNPMGNMVIEGYSTNDFGKNWKRNDNIAGFNGTYKSELLNVNNGVLTRLDKNFNKLSDQDIIFDDGFEFKGSGAHSVIHDSKGNIYFIYLSKLYRINRSN